MKRHVNFHVEKVLYHDFSRSENKKPLMEMQYDKLPQDYCGYDNRVCVGCWYTLLKKLFFW